MALQVQKRPLPGVPCLSTVLFLICLLLCYSIPKPCECSGSYLDQIQNLTLNYNFDQLPGYMFVGSQPCEDKDVMWGGPRNYGESPLYADALETKSMFFTLYSVKPLVNVGMSFSIVFSMSIYEPNNRMEENCRLVFVIKPATAIYDNHKSYMSLMDTVVTNACPILSDPTPHNVAGSKVSAQISTLHRIAPDIWVQIGIQMSGNSSVASKYSMWIDYDHTEDRILVYGDAGEGTPRPANPIANEILNRTWMMKHSASFGFFSSLGQLVQLHTWNSTTIRQLPSSCPIDDLIDRASHGNQWAFAWSSVLGSAAAAATATVIAYLNSKYRRWKTEQEKLVKTMRSLPGVPTQIDYAEIRKATKNFHGTMKLGKGGFGAVYRCMLAAAASRTGQSMEVAVKKFLREVEHQRYDDFLAEVSIINRLRHKNIVPLIGWSYNNGEPILIYEYMMNGSLDQHLFFKGVTEQRQQQQEEASIGKWQTRYSIAKDIAIGLHYVHHEHEPMVLHRDIKASNIMLDSTFRARLGDFGIASTVAVDRSSVTGIAGTWGYIAPEYAMTYRSTRQTDTYAFGVLILEIVTGKKNGDVPPDDDHITDWVWRLHQEGKLLDAVDSQVLTDAEDGQLDDAIVEAERLLLLGLACTNPNPSNRPGMVEAVQVITKLAPPPDVPLQKPTFMWPPEDWRLRNSVYSTAFSNCDGSSSASTIEMVQVSQVPDASSDITAAASVSCSGTVTFSYSQIEQGE